MFKEIKKQLTPFFVEKVHKAYDEWPELAANEMLENLVQQVMNKYNSLQGGSMREINLDHKKIFNGLAMHACDYSIKEYAADIVVKNGKIKDNYSIRFAIGYTKGMEDPRKKIFSNSKLLSLEISDWRNNIGTTVTDALAGKPAEVIMEKGKIKGVKNKWSLDDKLNHKRDNLFAKIWKHRENLSKNELKNKLKELNNKREREYEQNSRVEQKLREGNYGTLTDQQLVMYVVGKQLEGIPYNDGRNLKHITYKTDLGELLNEQNTKIKVVRDSFNIGNKKLYSEFVMLEYGNIEPYQGIFSKNRLLAYDVGIAFGKDYISIGTTLTDNILAKSIELIFAQSRIKSKQYYRGTIHDEVSKDHRYVQMRRSILEALYETYVSDEITNNTAKYIKDSWNNTIERIVAGERRSSKGKN